MNKLIHGANLSGQSLADRMSAAKHSIAGQGLAKSVCKATTEEVMGPKKKHLDYLLHCTNEPNVSIPQLANLMIERTQNGNWVVVYKALVSIHNLMNYGNERFTQYLASNNCTFNLAAFLDKGGVAGYDMSTYIRRYAKYINEKAFSYRTMAYDFCKVKRGKDDGLLRTMPADKLLKALPVLQQQLDALLEFDVTPNDLTNGVINACFMLLFKDLIRLFACYNDGIINLLEKYFEMHKKQCREALDLYKRFLVRMERTAEFLKVCESVGIDKGDIPDLAKAPSSLLDALEEHLKSLESAKKSGQPAPKVASKITSEISTFAAAATSGVNAAVISDEEKVRIIEEESKQLEQLRQKNKEKSSPTSGQPATETNPFSDSANIQATSSDLFGAGSPTHAANKPSDDLLNLGATSVNPFAAPAVQSNNPFASAASASSGAPAGSPWGSPSIQGQRSPQAPTMQNGTVFTTDAQFDQAFGNRPTAVGGAQPAFSGFQPMQPAQQQVPRPGMSNGAAAASSGFDGFGDIMQPGGNQVGAGAGAGMAAQPPHKEAPKLIGKDLDSSLASLAGNLSINPSQQVKKMDHQWGGASSGKTTGNVTGAQWTGGAQGGMQQGYPPAPSMGMGGSTAAQSSTLEHLMYHYHSQSGMQSPIVNQAPYVPVMAAGMMQPQMGYQQPAAMPGFQQQQQMGMGMAPRQPMGMGQQQQQQQQPMGSAPMFAGQQPMGQGQQAGGFSQQPSGGQQPNDPFGAL